MLKRNLVFVSFLFALLILPVSQASATIADAKVRKGGFDIGASAYFVILKGASAQYGISDNLSIGLDYVVYDFSGIEIGGIPFSDEKIISSTIFQGINPYLMYQIVKSKEGQPLNCALMAGVGFLTYSGDYGDDLPASKAIPTGGICFSSELIAKTLVGRLNLVYGLPLGAEIGWRITENLELNLGVSTMGIFGFKVSF